MDMPGAQVSDDHSSIDELADLDEGLLEPTRGDDVRAHLVGCLVCRARHEALRDVHDELAVLPPEPMPADVADRIDGALAAAALPRSATVVPLVTPARRQRGWPALAGIAAVVVLLAFVGAVLVGHHRNNSPSESASNALSSGSQPGSAAAPAHVKVSFSAHTYNQQTVTAAVQHLLSATTAAGIIQPDNAGGAKHAPAALPKPLHPLFESSTKLLNCAAAVAPVEGSVPEAAIFARYTTPTLKSAPSVIYVFPTTADRADIVVVGPSCAGVQQVRDELLQRSVR
jgi:hypothetical protein